VTGRTIIETTRLTLREATLDDAAFMLRLLTEPSWRRYIAEQDVETVDAAADYLAQRYLPAYASGIGLWIAVSRTDPRALGVCGLVRRPYLDDLDIGFAFLESCWGQGYAREAAEAVVDFAHRALGATRLLAITVPHNQASIALLERLGFSFDHTIRPPDSSETLSLYALDY
jgi:RimJ/RimL family protein N-acetyltransferase